MNIKDIKISSIDIEVTGNNPPEIVEIAVVWVVNGIIEGDISWLVKPNNEISWRAIKIHWINDNMLIDKLTFKDIKEEVSNIINNSYLLSHNVSVEKDFLVEQMPEWKPLGFIDTLKLSRKLITSVDSYSLEKLTKF